VKLSIAQTGRWSEGSSVTFGGFVDSYYAYDFNRPAEFDRAFTTQPARHNEFNINLAFIDAKLTNERVRGRVALQVGTSVQSNYAGEPGIGVISGGNLSRHIQEAVAGVKLAEGWWVDGGIYFSHLGFESFISRDNWTYTRSLASDYSPYYQTGVMVSGQFSPEWSGKLHVMNGWQIISENNSNKSVGLQLAYKPSSNFSITYNNFIGNEGSDNAPSQTRFFNDFIASFTLSSALQVAGIFDFGTQKKTDGGNAEWYVATLLGRWSLNEKVAAIGRVEYFNDKEQVIVATGTTNGFQTAGASFGIDYSPAPNIVWRTEVRGFASEDAIFPKGSGDNSKNDSFIVTSLGLSL
jgi:hypothetical protein